MKIQDVPGWPPFEIECAEQPALHFHPRQTAGFRIDKATFIPGMGKPGDIVLLLVDTDNAVECTARLKLKDDGFARRVLEALAGCVGLTVAQAGLRNIPA